MDVTEIEEEQAVFGSDHVVHGDPNIQELFAKVNPSIGLTLTKSKSFNDLFETQRAIVSTQFNNQHHSQAGTSTQSLVTRPSSEKLKATNFPIQSIEIGGWKRISQNEGDMMAKFYFAKKKIVWEVLDENILVGNEVKMKSKIEIVWSNIIGLNATIRDDIGILQIELDKPPVFFRETKPTPKKHTNWESNELIDFTNGHAFNSRIHCLTFPPKVLDKHYESLLQSDQRLLKLSRDPFPSQSCSHFHSTMIMSNFNTSRSSIIQQYQSPTRLSNSNSVMGFPRNYQPMAQRYPNHQGMNHPRPNIMNTQIGPLTSSRFASQVPAGQVLFSGQPSGHLTFEEAQLQVQMQEMNLLLDPNHHNNQVMPNGTDNNVYTQPNYSAHPFVSSDHDLVLNRYHRQNA
ncbi:hypothetical protein CASFOL_004345 [Castilleja foliolosa]|uniref:TRF2/HOY1 PH-like domain-containing protein n=1 Tax=Castilleja foliolosa TaxID=1961234 RepID=A0ABD3EA63_9LAMI